MFTPANIIKTAAVVTAVSISVTGYTLFDRFSQTNSKRAEQAAINKKLDTANRHSNDALRTVLCYFEGITLKDPKTTIEQAKQSVDIINNALKLIDEPPC